MVSPDETRWKSGSLRGALSGLIVLDAILKMYDLHLVLFPASVSCNRHLPVRRKRHLVPFFDVPCPQQGGRTGRLPVPPVRRLRFMG